MLTKPDKGTSFSPKKVSGFTLVEIIVSIVVLSIALSIISTLIVPAEQNSADQIHQVKAAELAQSILNDISSRAFDENSDMAGGLIRCGEPGVAPTPNLCTTNLADDGETTRGSFNDVDDFNGYKEKFNANDEDLADGYNSFDIEVEVAYDGTSLGFADNTLAKKITVTVTTPLGTKIKFATHKTNF